MPRILFTGSYGQVGFELRRALAPLGEVIGLTRRDMDLGDPASIVAALDRHQPDLIVNPAAYPAGGKAESEPALARAATDVGPGGVGPGG
ncbi:sugar nucleotide-binding protein, partial [Pseudomonas aeruginosa]